jgi:pimeloyl-ACP methyl ester carboxylesterase
MLRTIVHASIGVIAAARVAISQAPTTSLVDVGGRKVNVQAAGTTKPGMPTVVFESGFGTPVAAWKPLQADIATLTRTVAYDRAGTGSSEASTSARTVKQIATELHALLTQLNAPPPYVLVGHSWGGPIIHAFAGMFPKEVAGLVYIDPTDFMQTEAEMQSVFAKAGMKNGHDDMDALTNKVVAGMSPGLAAEFREVQRAQRDGFTEVRSAPEAPDVPMSVLLAAKSDPAPPGTTFPGDADRFFQATLDQRVDHFSRLARHSAKAHLVLTTNSSHFVHVAEPELVASEIRGVLSQASSHPELDRFVGEYALAPTVAVNIVREGDKLFAQMTGQQRFRLFAESPTLFSLRVVDVSVEFETDGTGAATALTLVQNGQRQRAPRKK